MRTNSSPWIQGTINQADNQMKFPAVVVVIGALLVSGCGVSQAEYDAVKAKLKAAEAQMEAVRVEAKSVRENFNKVKAGLDEILVLHSNYLAEVTAAAQLDDLPIRFDHRDASDGDGTVLHMQNFGVHPLPVQIVFSNATVGVKAFDRVLEPCEIAGPSVEIGRRDGWVLTEGDTAVVSLRGFQSKRITF
jgi:hypothetical protein